jgi:membrane-associated phospholipid phosphatase
MKQGINAAAEGRTDSLKYVSFDFRLAEQISFWLNPLFLVIPLFYAMFRLQEVWVAGQDLSLLRVMSAALFFFTLVPLAVLLIFRILGRIGSLEIRKRRNRHLPFLFGIISYAGGYGALTAIAGHTGPVAAAAFTLTAASIAAALITLKWKISIHCSAVAVSAVFFSMAAWFHPSGPLFISTVCFGILATVSMYWSRTKLGAHTPLQAVSGIGFGLLSAMLILLLYPI